MAKYADWGLTHQKRRVTQSGGQCEGKVTTGLVPCEALRENLLQTSPWRVDATVPCLHSVIFLCLPVS